MTDNLTVPGLGVVATKDVGSVHFQKTMLYAPDGTTPLIILEDATHSNGDPGIQSLVVRKDTAAALASADGKYQPLEVDSSGRLHVAPVALPAGSALIGKVGLDQTTPGTTNAVSIVDPDTPSQKLAIDSSGRITIANVIGVSTDTELPAAAALSDTTANPTAPMVGSAGMLYNGSTWERSQANREIALLASAARTATNSTAVQTNTNHRGLQVVLSITAVPGAGSLQVVIRSGWSTGSFTGATLNPDAPTINATGTYVFEVYPGNIDGGIGVTSTSIVHVGRHALPRYWFVTIIHATADSYTYSLWGHPIP